jgi:hypothetical protein
MSDCFGSEDSGTEAVANVIMNKMKTKKKLEFLLHCIGASAAVVT